MTRRVVQTDLFAAFKESQQQAEEQYGQKRKIHVEGTSLRQAAEYSTTSENAGYEVIIAKNTEPKIVHPQPQVVASPEPTIITAEEPVAVVTSAPVVEPPAPAPTPQQPAMAFQTELMQKPEIQQVEETVVIKPATPEPVLQAVTHEEPVAEEVKPEPTVTAPKEKIKRIEKPTDRIKIKPVEKKSPLAKTAAARKTVVTRKDPHLKQNVSKLKKENVERLTVTSASRQTLKRVPPAKQSRQEQETAPAVQPKAKNLDNLLKIAAIIAIITAAYIIGTKKEHPASISQRGNNHMNIGKKPANVDTNKVNKVAQNTINHKAVTTPPKEKTITKPTPTPIPKEKEEIIQIPVRMGNNSVLLCGGIDHRSALRLQKFLKKHETVIANGWEVFEYNKSIYVGRFENRKQDSFKKCVKFCKNLIYENKRQFAGAMFFPLPKKYQIKTK